MPPILIAFDKHCLSCINNEDLYQAYEEQLEVKREENRVRGETKEVNGSQREN